MQLIFVGHGIAMACIIDMKGPLIRYSDLFSLKHQAHRERFLGPAEGWQLLTSNRRIERYDPNN